jgi:hypothetical protein
MDTSCIRAYQLVYTHSTEPDLVRAEDQVQIRARQEVRDDVLCAGGRWGRYHAVLEFAL